MSNSNPTTPIIRKLRHEDGTEVTAQEAHDAFMNTRVLIVVGNITCEAVNMVWYDNNSSQNEPNNVGYVSLEAMFNNSGTASINSVSVGDSSLVPTQQG